MKTKIFFILPLAALLQGCIAVPPLIQVQHKDSAPSSNFDQRIDRRLESIERRLENLEKAQNQRR